MADPIGVLGYFEGPDDLLRAARALRGRSAEAFSPFPVPGLDEALGSRSSSLPWAAFAGGAAGLGLGMVALPWAASDYPLRTGGKAIVSWPAFVPVLFELTILASALAVVAGLVLPWALRRPGPVLDPGFTDDRFAVWIPAEGSGFDSAAVAATLVRLGASVVRPVEGTP